MTLLYRSLLSSHPEGLLADARSAFSGWLAVLGHMADVSRDGHQLDDALLIRSTSAPNPPCVLLRFDEGRGEERVRTTLFAGCAADTGWILVEVEAPEAGPSGARRLEEVPALVRTLLGRGARTGSWPLTGEPLEGSVSASEVARCLRTAALPLVVCVEPDEDAALVDDAAMAEVVRRALGMVVPFRLNSASAAELAVELPEMGSLRTGSLCYVVSERSETGVQRTDVPRTVVQSQPVAVARDIQRRALAHAVASGLPTSLANDLLRLPGMPYGPTVDEGEAFELLAELMQERDLARRELAILQNDHEETVLEYDEALEELDGLRRRTSFLERRLAEAGDFVAGIIEEEPLPTDVNTCSEALDLAREYLSRVVIVADLRPTRDLEGQARTSLWAKVAWQAMQAMQDYAMRKAEGTFGGDLLEFCADPPAGAVSFPAGRVALNESDSTNSNPECRRARTFPIPDSDDSIRIVYMSSHIKIAPVGSPAPRLHYFDDTGTGGTGRIYVGYLGPHLPTGG